MDREQSELMLQRALEFEENDQEYQAIEIYNKILIKDSKWSVPYYNLGLIYKYRNDWIKSFENNKIATQLNKEDQAAWWNLGIASTALKKWDEAKRAWEGFGLQVEFIENEVRMNIGSSPVRLQNGEVVWAQRICPARAIIENVPTKESGRRYRDMILNDGAPNGYRIYDGEKYSVFDELELITKSPYQTNIIKAKVENERAISVLEEWSFNKELGFENWTKSLRYICKQCSEGIPHEEHDQELEIDYSKIEVELALAAPLEFDLDQFLINWEKTTNSKLISVD